MNTDRETLIKAWETLQHFTLQNKWLFTGNAKFVMEKWEEGAGDEYIKDYLKAFRKNKTFYTHFIAGRYNTTIFEEYRENIFDTMSTAGKGKVSIFQVSRDKHVFMCWGYDEEYKDITIQTIITESSDVSFYFETLEKTIKYRTKKEKVPGFSNGVL